ncbi:MAG: S26 family signal peptidase, partial [Lachnospiraceae bacterium]|nr:S26 family signal peptidase [Lachnospiraceae bacterium]
MSRQKEEARQHTERKKGRSFLTAGIRFTGTLLLVALVAVCLPLTVPRFFGYHIYSVISGSMEPAIPTGSLVYIKTME